MKIHPNEARKGWRETVNLTKKSLKNAVVLQRKTTEAVLETGQYLAAAQAGLGDELFNQFLRDCNIVPSVAKAYITALESTIGKTIVNDALSPIRAQGKVKYHG